MPAKHEMRWGAKQRLWRRTYRNKEYTVSCRQLNAPPTQEGSYQAANKWWLAKKAEIDGFKPIHEHAETVEVLMVRRAWAQRRGDDKLAQFIEREIKRIEAGGEPFEIEVGGPGKGYAEALEAQRDIFPDNSHDPFEVMNSINMKDRVWSDRTETEAVALVPEDMTVGGQVDRWIATQREKAKAGRITADRFDNVRHAIERFREFHGGQLPIESLNETALENYFYELQRLVTERRNDSEEKAGLSDYYAKSQFDILKQFVRVCYRNRLIDLPRNLDSHELRISVEVKPVQTIPLDQVRRAITAARGQLKLHLLLMINCGFGPTDIAELQEEEVDWELGRIRRRRGKTRKNHRLTEKSVPVVNFKLWPITFELLKQYRSGKSTVLLTKSGKRWAYREMGPDGNPIKSNTIKVMCEELFDKEKIDLSLKFLRKTSATLIKSHESLGHLDQLFLGHAAKTMAERHYSGTPDALLDKAVDWLGEQYGYVTPNP